jgi:hypothetical protein
MIGGIHLNNVRMTCNIAHQLNEGQKTQMIISRDVDKHSVKLNIAS